MELRWNGNIKAEQEAKSIYAKWKYKVEKKKLEAKKNKSKKKNTNNSNKVGKTTNDTTKDRKWIPYSEYKTLWREKNKDLEALCTTCHHCEHECLVTANSHLASIMRST